MASTKPLVFNYNDYVEVVKENERLKQQLGGDAMGRHFEMINDYVVGIGGDIRVDHVGDKITRCKDCKHRFRYTGSERSTCTFRSGPVTDNGFCEMGEPEKPGDYYWLIDEDGCTCSNCDAYFYNDDDAGEIVKEYSHCPECGVFITGQKEV